MYKLPERGGGGGNSGNARMKTFFFSGGVPLYLKPTKRAFSPQPSLTISTISTLKVPINLATKIEV